MLGSCDFNHVTYIAHVVPGAMYSGSNIISFSSHFLRLCEIDVFASMPLHVAQFSKRRLHYLSLVMRKTSFCLLENKDADQLSSYCTADQRLCFRCSDSTILPLPLPKTSKTGFLASRPA